jgi:hypothetical protein
MIKSLHQLHNKEKSKNFYSSLLNKVNGWKQLDLQEHVVVLEAALLYFNFIFLKQEIKSHIRTFQVMR